MAGKHSAQAGAGISNRKKSLERHEVVQSLADLGFKSSSHTAPVELSAESEPT
jgi:hypothetical protein